jgi:ATP-dependent Lon protease
MRTQNVYSLLFDQLVKFEKKADVRDSNAIKRIATAYMKLIFPQWQKIEDVDVEEFRIYCLEPAIHRRGIIKEQCHNIDPEFKVRMPDIQVIDKGFTSN